MGRREPQGLPPAGSIKPPPSPAPPGRRIEPNGDVVVHGLALSLVTADGTASFSDGGKVVVNLIGAPLLAGALSSMADRRFTVIFRPEP